mgnify:CR=1 FL=1
MTKVVVGISGGVDSSVAAVLVHKAIGDNLTCVFVDHGLLRKNEGDDVERIFRDKFDMTILLIEHDLKFVSGLCDRITVLNFGTVLTEGTAQDALNHPEVVKAYIGN